MTREEAITVLKAFNENPLCSDKHIQAFKIAIHDIKEIKSHNNLHDVSSDDMTLEQTRQAVKDLRKKLRCYLILKNQLRSNLNGVIIALDILDDNHPLRPKMEGAKDTLEDVLDIIDKIESEDIDD